MAASGKKYEDKNENKDEDQDIERVIANIEKIQFDENIEKIEREKSMAQIKGKEAILKMELTPLKKAEQAFKEAEEKLRVAKNKYNDNKKAINRNNKLIRNAELQISNLWSKAKHNGFARNALDSFNKSLAEYTADNCRLEGDIEELENSWDKAISNSKEAEKKLEAVKNATKKPVEQAEFLYKQAQWQATYLEEKDPAKKLNLYLSSRNLDNNYSPYIPGSTISDFRSEISLDVLKYILDDHPELKCPQTMNKQPFLSFILSSQVTPWHKLCEITNYLLERDRIKPALETIEYAHSIHESFTDSHLSVNAKSLATKLIKNLLSYAEPTVREEFLNKHPTYKLALLEQPSFFSASAAGAGAASPGVENSELNKPKQG